MADLTFEIAGEGAPVVCLMDAHAAALMDVLTDDFRVISIAPEKLEAGAAQDRARALLTAAKAQAGGAFALLAQGEDAIIALHAAALDPDTIPTLVLLSPQAFDERGAPREPSLAAALANVQAQTLALFGTRDAVASPAVGGHYKRALPFCHLMYVYDAENTAHERLEAVSEVVLDFLRRRDAFLVSDKDGRVHA